MKFVSGMPHVQRVKFRTTGANKLTAIFIGLSVAGLGIFMVFTAISKSQIWAASIRDFLATYSMIVIGFVSATISSLFAYTMGLKRLYTYGLLILILFTTGHFVTIPFEYILLTIGFGIVFYGLVMLFQFIQKHPIVKR